MNLRELARQHGRKLTNLGVAHITARSINCGMQRAGSEAIRRISESLNVDTAIVAQACDESWNRSHAAKLTPPVGA